MNLKTELYTAQLARWPTEGKHILGQFTDEYVIVYQAYNKNIGRYAAENQHFGGGFRFSRMSWIKTNFLWMMYRSGWGTKPNQETTLAIYLKREYFMEILKAAFPSSNILGLSKEDYKAQVAKTDVRLQWDPDHDPYGAKQERKAIQLGLRNEYLAPFRGEGIMRIEDISNFVSQQRVLVESGELDKLITPQEHVLQVPNAILETIDMSTT